MRSKMRYRVIWWVLVILLVLVGVKLFPWREGIGNLLAWIRTIGPAAPVIFVLVYILACVLLLPGSLITLGAGFLFGVAKGFVVVSVGSVAGATAAFLIGRTAARQWIGDRVKGRPKFEAVDEAVGQRGFYIVLLTRLSPLFPFTLLNYFYGITAVTLRDYVLASWIGMVPGTLMYVYLGSIAKSLTELLAGQSTAGRGTTILFWLGLVATVAVAILVTRVARRALDEVIAGKGAAAAGRLGEEGSDA
jgi:uncharacterized membrane protein YdjX (TVP38/TMEM64 family)